MSPWDRRIDSSTPSLGDPVRLTPILTPQGRLAVAPSDDAPELGDALARRLIDAFERGAGHGLLHLGGAEVGESLRPVFSYWRELGARYVTTLCTRPSSDAHQRPGATGRKFIDILSRRIPLLPAPV